MFDQKIDRSGSGSLKGTFLSPETVAAGVPGYWGAEFEFPTCPAFSEGVIRCAQSGYYPFTLQTDAYNAAVCWWMENVRRWTVEKDWIVPTHGTIFSLATCIRMTLRENEKLILLQPGYSRYEQAATRLHRACTHVHMAYDPKTAAWRLDLQALEAAMADPANRLLAFSNPNNPTGLILTDDELHAIDALSRKYGVTVFCDEIFAEVVWDGAHVTPYSKIAQSDSPAVTCTSLGKCMSLTGVNHANVFIRNEDLRARFIAQRYADHYGSIDPMLYAGLISAYSPAGKAFVDELCGVIRRNYTYFKQNLERILPGARVTPCKAAFLAWVDFSGTGLSEDALNALLEKALFAGDPGSEYHVSNFFARYSIACPFDMLERSMALLEETLAKRSEKGEKP